MAPFLSSLRLPALIGILATLPFTVMELVNRRGYGELFPWQLFLILWFLAAGFTFALLPIIRNVRARQNLLRRPVLLAVRVAAMLAFAFIWVQGVVDQIPCFLGVLLCD